MTQNKKYPVEKVILSPKTAKYFENNPLLSLLLVKKKSDKELMK